jgi:uncharacterized protein YfdQ (DUF2303 family)
MTTDNIQAAIDAGITIAKPQAVGTSGRFYSVTVPEGGAHQLIDLEKAQEELRETPRRKRGTFAAYDAGSFTTYMSKHATEHSEVWADIKRRTITAVINAHGNVDADPGWADHRLVLQLRHTPAWEAWTKDDRNPLPQSDFAEHLEDWRSDVVEPTAADLTELSRTFKATKKVEFSESKLLSTGQVQLSYSEVVDAKAGTKGDIEIPEMFKLGLQPFEGSARYEIGARLRFDISTGQLRLTYVLDRPEEVLRAAFADILLDIDNGISAPIFQGTTA